MIIDKIFVLRYGVMKYVVFFFVYCLIQFQYYMVIYDDFDIQFVVCLGLFVDFRNLVVQKGILYEQG